LAALFVVFLAVFLAAPDLFAAVFLAGADFLAVVLFAVVFLAGDLFAVDFFAALDLFAVVFFAGDLFAVDFLAVDFLAGDFLAVDFFAVVFLAALDLFAVVFLAAPDLLAVVFLALDFFAVAVAFLVADGDAASVNFGGFLAPDTTSFRPAPAVNFGTAVFLALIRAPVWGLRTQRAPRTRFSNEPKPVIATFSPLATSRVIVSRTDSSAC